MTYASRPIRFGDQKTIRSLIGWSLQVLEECKRGQLAYCPINDLATEPSGPPWERREKAASPGASDTHREDWKSNNATGFRDKRFLTAFYTLFFFFFFKNFLPDIDGERRSTAADRFPLPDPRITMKHVGSFFFTTPESIAPQRRRQQVHTRSLVISLKEDARVLTCVTSTRVSLHVKTSCGDYYYYYCSWGVTSIVPAWLHAWLCDVFISIIIYPSLSYEALLPFLVFFQQGGKWWRVPHLYDQHPLCGAPA